MQITLTSNEFDEAVSLWLKEQGFSTDRYSISTRVIAGRTDSGSGTRMEVTLDPLPSKLCTLPETTFNGVFDAMKTVKPEIPLHRRFGQGHTDE